MKFKSLTIFILMLVANNSFAQSSSDSSSSKSHPPKVDSLPNKESKDYYRDETGALIDVEGDAKSNAAHKKMIEPMGYKHATSWPGQKNYVEDRFSMPENEGLVGCIYGNGFSYPDICLDDKGKVIFDSSKHNQKVLDKVIDKQGKRGKYNKIPGGGPVKLKGIGELE